MNRIQWIQANILPSLQGTLKRRENLDFSLNNILEVLIAADPNRNHSAVQWIAKCYSQGGFLWEDIQDGKDSRVHDTLVLFKRVKSKLPVLERNIYHYQMLGDLWNAIEPFVQEIIEKEEKSKAEIYLKENETRVLLDQNGLKVVVPLTQEASQWWGRGTRWCTAASKGNRFHQYNRYAPLLICLYQDLLGKHHKFQFWNASKALEMAKPFDFMDESDKPVEYKFIHENWKAFEPLIRLINIAAYTTLYTPTSLITMQEAKNALLYSNISTTLEPAFLDQWQDNSRFWNHSFIVDLICNTDNIRYCPRQFITEEVVQDCLQKDWTNIRKIKAKDIVLTKNLIKTALKGSLHSISWIDPSLLDQNMWFEALEGNPTYEAARLVPDQFKDQHWWTEFGYLFQGFYGVPEDFITQEFYIRSIEKTARALEWVPKNMRTYRMCVQAVLGDSDALIWVPEPMKTLEICKLAVERKGSSIQYVPEIYQNKELWKSAVTTAGILIKRIPEEFIDQEIASLALKSHVGSIMWIPKRFIGEEDSKFAVEANGISIKYIPQQWITPELCLKAVKSNRDAFRYIPDRMKTIEICKISLGFNPESIQYVPERYLTNQICIEVLKKNGYLLEWLPKQFLKHELIEVAIESCPSMIHWIPENMATKDLWIKAIKKDPELLESMPKEWIKPEFYQDALQKLHYKPSWIPEEYHDKHAIDKATQDEEPLWDWNSLEQSMLQVVNTLDRGIKSKDSYSSFSM